jgi:hypothetical protein
MREAVRKQNQQLTPFQLIAVSHTRHGAKKAVPFP